MEKKDNILEIRNLEKKFTVRRSFLQMLKKKPADSVHAVDGVTFSMKRGEVTGLVGESGCGKSSLAKVLMNLYPADDGDIIFEGKSIVSKKPGQKNSYGTRMQMVFQDPYASLNPRMTIRQMFYEILSVHRICSRKDREKEAVSVLEMVGLDASVLDSFPGQFSGGQRQRISIARALVVHPDLLVADEAITALGVSIQAQIINLLMDLRNELNLSMLFISHDLSVVRYLSDQVVVMYLGKIMETAESEDLFEHPLHPYTQILLQATPVIGAKNLQNNKEIQGEPPSPMHIPSGCRFHTRCPYATAECEKMEPPVRNFGNGHCTACWHPLREQESNGTLTA
mgnify:CR=1 FL=1